MELVPDELHTEGKLLTGYAGLGWAVAMQRLFQEAQQSMFNAGQGILTRRVFITTTMFQVMTPALGLMALLRAGMPFMFVMQQAPKPQTNGKIVLAR